MIIKAAVYELKSN